jgi:hypothetical protein
MSRNTKAAWQTVGLATFTAILGALLLAVMMADRL